VRIALKSESLSSLKSLEPVHACNGMALPLPLPYYPLITLKFHAISSEQWKALVNNFEVKMLPLHHKIYSIITMWVISKHLTNA